jgi:hypothetical protein
MFFENVKDCVCVCVCVCVCPDIKLPTANDDVKS